MTAFRLLLTAITRGKKTLSIPAIFFLFLFSSCEKKKQIIDQGIWKDKSGHAQIWDEYLLHDSCFKSWYENGKVVRLMRSKSKEEMADSSFTEDGFFENGTKRSYRKENTGKIVGECYEWFMNGQMHSDHKFVNGKEASYYSWFENGKPETEAVTDSAGGIAATYYTSYGTYMKMQVDSMGSGQCRVYYSNARAKEEGELFRRTRIGIWKSWDSLGNPLKDSLYGLPKIK